MAVYTLHRWGSGEVKRDTWHRKSISPTLTESPPHKNTHRRYVYCGNAARTNYSNGVGAIPRARGLPRNPTHQTNSAQISEKIRKDVRARRMFVCSAQSISIDTPINATPKTTVEGKIAIAQLSLIYGRWMTCVESTLDLFNPSQYCPVRLPTVEALARLFVSTTVSLAGIPIEMAKRYCVGFPPVAVTPVPVVINVHGLTWCAF